MSKFHGMLQICLTAYLWVAMTQSVLGNNMASVVCGDETGFNCLFQSNKDEMVDVPVAFDNPLPTWLTGTLVRNGVGQFEMGNSYVSHVFDGFAKLASWKFLDNGTTLFSTRFVSSRYYKHSTAHNTIAPFLLFSPPKPPFPNYKKPLCFLNGLDNMNVNVMSFSGTSGGTSYAVFTDYWGVYQIAINDLSTIKLIKPKLNEARPKTLLKLMSSAHPLPEPGTTNRLTFLIRQNMLPFGKHRLDLVRMTSVSGRTLLAEWEIAGRTPYMHSFSVTETKAVMLTGPFMSDSKCLFQKASPLPCMKWFGDKFSNLYIADIKTGAKITVQMPPMFALHHINAYDINGNEIIMDVAAYDSPEVVNKQLMMDVIRDEKTRSASYEPPRNKRIHINLSDKTVTVLDLSTSDSISDGVDMPAINEAFRSKHYCYVYGVNNFADGKNYTSSSVLKKNVCEGGRVEAAFYTPFHYPVEPVFVRDPAGSQEDDGVLLVPVLRGKDAVTYLAVVDAKTMTVVSTADTPSYIPFSLHGRFFKDAF